MTPTRDRTLLVLLAFVTVYVVWGSTYLAIRFGIETIPPFFMAGVRFCIGGTLFVSWAVARGAPPPERSLWPPAALVGALMIVGGIGGVTWAEQFVPSGLTALLIAMVPLWVVLIDWIRPAGTYPGAAVFVGLVIGLTGMVLLVNPTGAGEVAPIGAMAIVGATLSWACGSVYSRHARQSESQVVAIGMPMLAGGVILMAVSGATGELATVDLGAISSKSVLALAYLIGPGSLAYAAYLFLLRASTPTKAATYAYVNPIIALVLGAAIGGEQISGWTISCSAVIITGVVVIVTAKSRSGSH
ncbi:MAG: EamA family transporter [Vicinamibacterales bacterium]|jgi:drug/metabolite transporter (DMT)-like permease|nr:hypothetical protein [Acidobacteriota bacterium]MDP7295739.1 EamA family transporter [Vicinamibacterales bacterium]MDP7672433.1 EamA family transporter [Vicinamibacterales bacterium]HJO38508.1 EamA family transporter [Vicinamibacterales bacterium]